MKHLQRLNFKTKDAKKQSARFSTVSNLELVSPVYDLILADQQISAKRILDTLEISGWGRSKFIIYEYLGTRKLSAKLVPKCQQETISSGHNDCNSLSDV